MQALVSPFLLDDSAENIGEGCSSYPGNYQLDGFKSTSYGSGVLIIFYSCFPGDEVLGIELDEGRYRLKYDHNHLNEIDPVSANRIHPNNHRKVRLPAYSMYILPMNTKIS